MLRDISHRSKSLLAADLKTAYQHLISKSQTGCWYRCQILIDFSRWSASERMEASCFISVCRLLEADVIPRHVDSYWGLWQGAGGWAPPKKFRLGSPGPSFFPQSLDAHDDKLIVHYWMSYLIERFTGLFVAGALAVLFIASMRDQARFLHSSPIMFNEQYLCMCQR